MTTKTDMVCIECGRTPSQIQEYVDEANYLNGMEDSDIKWTPEMFVEKEEGTYNSANGHFACTDCYIKLGMPTSSRGWVAP